jgi:alanyl-tRNA synthetase
VRHETERLHYEDPYLLEFDAAVVARRDHKGRPVVVLDRTAFYAESGGQPWDTGLLADVPVVAVIEDQDEVLHVLERPLAADRVHGRVDADRRRDHLQQHHGQHLLSRAFIQTAGAATLSFHLGSETTSIDLDKYVGEAEITAAERLVNQVIWESRPVRVLTVDREEARRHGVEPPPEATDAVRLVEVKDFDLQPCGGTHPKTTSEVGIVVVTGSERYKGGSRIQFLCGHRALTGFHRRASILERMGAVLSAPLDGLPEAAERALAQVAEASHRAQDLLDQVVESEARRLLAQPAAGAPVIVSVYDGWGPAELKALALRLVSHGRCLVFLGGRTADKVSVVVAQSDGLPHDVPALLKRVLEPLGGRGGGKGNLAQGGADKTDQLEAALRAASLTVRSADNPA